MVMHTYKMKVERLINPTDAINNNIYSNDIDGYYEIDNKVVLHIVKRSDLKSNYLYLNNIQRQFLNLALFEDIQIKEFNFNDVLINNDELLITIKYYKNNKNEHKIEINEDEILNKIKKQFINNIISRKQQILFEYHDIYYIIEIVDFSPKDSKYYKIHETSQINIFSDSEIKFISNKPNKNLFKQNWDFQQLGIGGLDREFEDIFRQAFASRIYPPSVVMALGIKHTRGMLLHGPPGTGKTLIARKISMILNCHEPKIINGPEILSKFVGESEQNIRNLFNDAENDQKKYGENSKLHIIIFDEFDAISRDRGSSSDSTGSNDKIVNQLLSKIEGVNLLNNIFIIAMTNRKDLIDEALLRPGRLEIHVKIGLPDEKGRLQILKIHTNNMKKHNFLSDEVDLNLIAHKTYNYSGAELEGLIRIATSNALYNKLDIKHLDQVIDKDKIKITNNDFEMAILKIKPNFGTSESIIDQFKDNKIIEFNEIVTNNINKLKIITESLINSININKKTILIQGDEQSGKTTIAIKTALNLNFPYVKIVNGENFMNMSETKKNNKLNDIFMSSYESELSILIIDDIERIIEFSEVGMRYLNSTLQTLMILIKKIPINKNKKLLIIVTSSEKDFLRNIKFNKIFNEIINLPNIANENELQFFDLTNKIIDKYDLPISIKNLLSK